MTDTEKIIVTNHKTGGLLDRIRRFPRDTSGMGAVEFAIVLPLLLMLYISGFELTVGLSIAKRVANAAENISIIISQKRQTEKRELATMMDAASAAMMPYATTDAAGKSLLKMKITGINVNQNMRGVVAWSWDQNGGRPYAPGEEVRVPLRTGKPSTFIVRTELSIPHDILMFMPGSTSSKRSWITISKVSHFQQRMNAQMTCQDC